MDAKKRRVSGKNHYCVGEGRAPGELLKGSVLAVLLFLFIIIVLPQGAVAQTVPRNVTTEVNVTNAAPDVRVVTLLNPTTLSAGTTKMVYCNATLRDWNGYDDIMGANATFYYFRNSSSDPDDRNVHYSNASCNQSANDGNFTANYTCTFDVYFHANNGTWYCNITAWDSVYWTSGTNNTNISALYSVNVTDVIDYGNLSVNDYSNNITATVTNFGNLAVNVSVLGYGATQGDGYGLICQYGNNISVTYERFTSDSSVDWSAKTVLAATNKDVGITLQKQTLNDTPVSNYTYWQLFVPPNPFGLCTGIVRFTATAP